MNVKRDRVVSVTRNADYSWAVTFECGYVARYVAHCDPSDAVGSMKICCGCTDTAE